MSEIKPRIIDGHGYCCEDCPEHNGPGLSAPPTCMGLDDPRLPYYRMGNAYREESKRHCSRADRLAAVVERVREIVADPDYTDPEHMVRRIRGALTPAPDNGGPCEHEVGDGECNETT